MNSRRVALAAVAATIFDAVYGFAVYGTLLAPEFAKYPNVYRTAESGQAFLPPMFGGLVIALIAVTLIYAKGYEGGSGLAEGARFGLLLGIFVLFAFAAVNFATLNINRKLAGMVGVAGFVEWTVIGTIIGLIYKPAKV